MFEAFFVALSSVWADSGFSALTGGHVIMICVGLLLLYMAIAKGFEPLLLSPIAFGCILANIPLRPDRGEQLHGQGPGA